MSGTFYPSLAGKEIKISTKGASPQPEWKLPRDGDPESAHHSAKQRGTTAHWTISSEMVEAPDAQETGLRLKEAAGRLSVVTVTHISAYKRIGKLLNVYFIQFLKGDKF